MQFHHQACQMHRELEFWTGLTGDWSEFSGDEVEQRPLNREGSLMEGRECSFSDTCKEEGPQSPLLIDELSLYRYSYGNTFCLSIVKRHENYNRYIRKGKMNKIISIMRESMGGY